MAIVTSPVNMEERKGLGIKAGDTVRVTQKVAEKDGFRLQAFEGLVLAVKHGTEAGSTFTVRKVTSGVGVEKVFPLYSPMIDKIEIVRRSKVRRAKLYYIRDKVSREMKRALRRMTLTSIGTKGSAELAAEEAAAKAEQDAQEAAAKAAAEVEAAVVADTTKAE
jgi:large subunit ribosomal protein L19